MTNALQQNLFDKYPKIFGEKDLPMTQTCMCWGLDCGDGWYPMIEFLCNQLQWDTDRNGYPQVVATQIKEKYGTLRFYYTSDTSVCSEAAVDQIERMVGVQDGMISTIENLSAYVCEGCGINKGVFQTKGWIRTTCQQCEDKRAK